MLNTKMIGNKIAEARKRMNLSQAELAEHLFISSQAVGKWERGESMPDIITLNRLAEILRVDLNYFSGSIPSPATGSDGNRTAPVESPVKQKTESQPGEQDRPAAPAHGRYDEARPGKAVEKPSWDMSQGNWADADFSGLKNLHEKFSSSNMQRCKFIGSDLSGLLLKGNNVAGCDFSGSEFGNSRIQNSNLANNMFKGCSLKGTEFSGSNIDSCNFSAANFTGTVCSRSFISGCDFSGADLTGMVLKSGGFEKNTLANAVLNRTSFIATHLADMVFDGTLEDCYFENCDFKKVTFQNATLINTFFKNNSLKRIRFIDCQADRMTYEFLKNGKANLSGITLITPKGGDE